MTASPTVAGDNSALELLQTINATAKFNDWLGLKVLSASQSGVEIEILWKEDLGQYAGFLHAGVIAGLIDTVCGFAAAVVVGRVLASHFSVNCLRPAVGTRFVARGRVTKPGRRQAFCSADLFAFDDKGKETLVATGETILVPLAAAA
jgi:uncharacterized protein (TIGR00369 family)